MERLIQFLQQSGIRYVRNLSLRDCTSFKIGGDADIAVYPAGTQDAAALVRFLLRNQMPYLVLGNGSNILAPDKGLREVVIKTDDMNSVTVQEDTVTVYAGCLNVTAANAAWKRGLSGMEFLHGIPGSIGGAVYMNAGAYESQVSDILVQTEYVNGAGQICCIDLAQHLYGYRESVFTGQDIICKSTFRLRPAAPDAIKQTMSELMQRRRQKQPLSYPSAGSVFKRPPGHYAGKLIEDCGLKGYTVGGAQVSEKHAGFIINIGNATAEDVKILIAHIQKSVYEKFDIHLQTEVKIL